MSLCIGCMHEIGSDIICPDCGFDNSQTQSAPFLPYGVVLDKRYVIGKNIETNGESTLYIGFDRNTSKKVLVREFLPAGYFTRGEGMVKINIDPAKAETFERLMSDFEQFFSFLSTLKEMSAMNVITDIFRANNTCYVVEDAEELISFEEYVERNNGHIEWEVARPLFMPVISLLETLHKNGYGHYAVSPANLYITTSGKALLLGFATINERRRGTALKSQLFTGCAAPEQYEQGFPIDNITDIYGFTATLFYALTGTLPANAKDRLDDGALLMSTSTVKRLPPHVVSALANGLQVKREDRIIDFGDLRSQLSVAPTVKAIQEEISRTASMATTIKPQKKNYGMSPISVGIIVTVVSLLIFLGIGILIIDKTVTTNDPETTTAPTDTTVSTLDDEGWTGPTMGNYIGMDYDTVKSELEAMKVAVYMDVYDSEDDGYSDTFDEGVIMEQSFPEGTPLDGENGFAVTFKVSKGSKARTLPDVENTSLSSAVTKLTDLGFVVYQDTTTVHSDTVAEGKVIGYKGHSAGESVLMETPIYLVVSAGAETDN
ncbi:MAG: PASTA domain-containing protein [Clostridia bacterium]|nr:PASTA domain-containing protein [Clostridia bacterium]